MCTVREACAPCVETVTCSRWVQPLVQKLHSSGSAPSVVTRMVRACWVAAVRPCGLRRVITVAQLAAPPGPPGSACTRQPSSDRETTSPSMRLCMSARRPAASAGSGQGLGPGRRKHASLQRSRHTVPGMGVGSTVPPTSGVASDRWRGSAAWSSSTGDPGSKRALVGHAHCGKVCSDGR